MELNIKIIDIETVDMPTKNGGTYGKAIITYRNLENGRTEAQTLVDFANRPLFEQVTAMEAGTEISVFKEKEGQYWQWKTVGAVGEVKPAPAQDATPAKPATTNVTNISNNGKLTNEEYLARDDAKQLMIVRQSCLSTVASVSSEDTHVDTLIEMADVLVDFVYNGTQGAGNVPTDIPADQLEVA